MIVLTDHQLLKFNLNIWGQINFKHISEKVSVDINTFPISIFFFKVANQR